MSFDYQTNYTGSPLNCNIVSTEVATVSPVNNSSTLSYVYVATGNNLYSSVNTLSPVISNIHTRVAVVTPLISNTAFSPVVISSPVINSNTYSIGATTKEMSTHNLSMEEEYTDGKHSRLNQSNSSIISNGSLLNDSSDRYSLVGYNTSPTTRSCGRDNKAGWYEMHERHVEMASRLKATVVLCGDSIIAGLTRYSGVWNKHFKPWNALNCGIGGDQTQHVLWRMENMVLPYTVKYIVVHCGTNNIDKDSSQEIANGVISCGLVLQENNPDLKIIITGLLPRDLENSKRRHKISQTNKFLKRYCRQFSNFTYMKQDKDWVHVGGLLNEELYYSDHLHLIESGNHKFARSIVNVLNKLSDNEEIIYSDDEDDYEINDYKFERKRGETRLDTPKRDTAVYKSPFKLIRANDTVTQKRKRTLSPVKPIEITSTSLKRRKTESYLNSKEHLKCDDSNSTPVTLPKKHTPNHDDPNSTKRIEYHGQFLLTKELKHDKELEGTAKSIDITLADRERREARKAKFGGVGSAAGSNLKRLSDRSKANILSPSTVIKIKSTDGDSKKKL